MLITSFSALSQEDIKTVDDSAFEKKTRPPAVFFHDAHNENAGIYDCNECHHIYEDGKRSDDETSIGMECSECHYAKDRDAIIDLIRSYHLLCSGCHLQQKAGPVICGQCHRKQ